MTDSTAWRTCRICGETKPLAMFYRDRRRNGEARIVRRYECRECARRTMRESYRENVEFLHEYKLERGCVDCGYREHAEALDFDHLPGVEKSFTIGQVGIRKNRDVLLAEIAKCEVVCANCHRVRTKRRGSSKDGGWRDLRKLGLPIPDDQAFIAPHEQLQLDLGA